MCPEFSSPCRMTAVCICDRAPLSAHTAEALVMIEVIGLDLVALVFCHTDYAVSQHCDWGSWRNGLMQILLEIFRMPVRVSSTLSPATTPSSSSASSAACAAMPSHLQSINWMGEVAVVSAIPLFYPVSAKSSCYCCQSDGQADLSTSSLFLSSP